MTEEKQKRILGIVCMILGAGFTIAGIVFFILSNQVNFQTQSVDATIVGQYELITEEGQKKTMLELSYRVGDEVIMSNYEYVGVLEENQVSLEVRYDIKNPRMVLEAKWSFEAIFVILLGAIILVAGLVLYGKIILPTIDAPTESEMKKNSVSKELYMARKRVVEGIFPLGAGVLFVVFGIFLMLSRGEWWSWIFIGVGAVELLYIGLDFFPALFTMLTLSKVNRIKGKVYDVEMSDDISEEAIEPQRKDAVKKNSVSSKK